MKNYDDFLALLTKEEIRDIVNSAKEPLNAVQDGDHSVTREGNSVAVISLSISLALLERYHQWLHE